MSLRKAVAQPINSPVFERNLVNLKLGDIRPHPKNPNVGDVDSINESIEELGLFDPLIWNRRNKCLVAGHHTWLTLRKRGWTEFPAVVVDVDEETHVRMMLAHNAVAARGKREPNTLAELLKELDSVGATRGTGYSQEEIRKLIDTTNRDLDRARQTLAKEDTLAAKAAADLDDLLPETQADLSDSLADDFDSLPDSLPSVYTLRPREALRFPGVGEWDIPELLPDYIPTYDELPHDIKAWAGSATRDWPVPDQWWLYTIKVDSTSGIQDLTRVIPCFYHHDEYTEVWWQNPEKYVGRVVYSGMQYIVSPDFTPTTNPRFKEMEALYKNRWMARYMQEANLKVIPNINWATSDLDFLRDHTLPTMPHEPNMIAIQIQTAFAEARDKAAVAQRTAAFAEGCQTVFDTLKPKGALIYYGKVGRDAFEDNVKVDCPIIWVEGRTNALGEKGKRNMRKRTL